MDITIYNMSVVRKYVHQGSTFQNLLETTDRDAELVKQLTKDRISTVEALKEIHKLLVKEVNSKQVPFPKYLSRLREDTIGEYAEDGVLEGAKEILYIVSNVAKEMVDASPMCVIPLGDLMIIENRFLPIVLVQMLPGFWIFVTNNSDVDKFYRYPKPKKQLLFSIDDLGWLKETDYGKGLDHLESALEYNLPMDRLLVSKVFMCIKEMSNLKPSAPLWKQFCKVFTVQEPSHKDIQKLMIMGARTALSVDRSSDRVQVNRSLEMVTQQDCDELEALVGDFGVPTTNNYYQFLSKTIELYSSKEMHKYSFSDASVTGALTVIGEKLKEIVDLTPKRDLGLEAERDKLQADVDRLVANNRELHIANSELTDRLAEVGDYATLSKNLSEASKANVALREEIVVINTRCNAGLKTMEVLQEENRGLTKEIKELTPLTRQCGSDYKVTASSVSSAVSHNIADSEIYYVDAAPLNQQKVKLCFINEDETESQEVIWKVSKNEGVEDAESRALYSLFQYLINARKTDMIIVKTDCLSLIDSVNKRTNMHISSALHTMSQRNQKVVMLWVPRDMNKAGIILEGRRNLACKKVR